MTTDAQTADLCRVVARRIRALDHRQPGLSVAVLKPHRGDPAADYEGYEGAPRRPTRPDEVREALDAAATALDAIAAGRTTATDGWGMVRRLLDELPLAGRWIAWCPWPYDDGYNAETGGFDRPASGLRPAIYYLARALGGDTAAAALAADALAAKHS